jgi:hypothetical protein
MAQISRRRTDQLGDFVTVLKLSAIDLQHRTSIANERLCQSLYEACFAGAGWSQKQKVSDWASRSGHSREECLINIYDLIDGLFLADYQFSKVGVQLLRFVSRLRRIQLFI